MNSRLAHAAAAIAAVAISLSMAHGVASLAAPEPQSAARLVTLAAGKPAAGAAPTLQRLARIESRP